MMRSLLFVPGDSEKKLSKADDIPTDVLILDLEDSVAPSKKAEARARVREYLVAHSERHRTRLWVRINPLGTRESLLDLVAVVGGRPDGIMQPKTRSAEDVIHLSHHLEALEAQNGLAPGSIGILPVATETPRAMFALGGFSICGARLAALTWGAEDLSAAMGAVTNILEDGDWTHPYQLARSLCLFGAHAAGVSAIDTAFTDFRDSAGLRTASLGGRRDGFSGKIAIHPDQVGVINESFTPTAEEVARARRIVEQFEASPNAGTVALDGQMLDAPHLQRARKTVDLAAKGSR